MGWQLSVEGGIWPNQQSKIAPRELVERGAWGRAEDTRLLVGGRDQGAVGVPPGLPADGYRKVVVGLEAAAWQSRHS